jgi:hypothetical protein
MSPLQTKKNLEMSETFFKIIFEVVSQCIIKYGVYLGERKYEIIKIIKKTG